MTLRLSNAWQLALAAAALVGACVPDTRKGVPAEEKEKTITVAARTPLIAAYPCSSCHATRTPNPEKRKLREFHVIRTFDFDHGEDAFWCYQCHAQKDMDRFVTSTGALVGFDEAYKLCTSCHGDKYEEWSSGRHGLRLGDWNGPRTVLSCPACHNPHDPRYPTTIAEKPPAPIEPLTPF